MWEREPIMEPLAVVRNYLHEVPWHLLTDVALGFTRIMTENF